MTARLLLDRLKGVGLTLFADGGRLRLRGDASAYTAELRADVDASRPALLRLLAPRLRQFVWTTGHWENESVDVLLPVDVYPTGCWWWRWLGEREWHPVPSTGGVSRVMPTLEPRVIRSDWRDPTTARERTPDDWIDDPTS